MLKKWSYFFISLLAFFICSLIIRIPIFLSDNFWFNGDEALVGIMAQDFLRTGKVPFYFYGQNYGFASIEVLITAAFIKVFGSGILALKLSGIFVYASALAMIRLLFIRHAVGHKLRFTLYLIFLTFPTYMHWAMEMGSLPFLLLIIVLFFSTSDNKVNEFWMIFFLILLSFSSLFFFLFASAFVLYKLNSPRFNFVKTLVLIMLVLLANWLVYMIFTEKLPIHEPAYLFGLSQIKQLALQFSGIMEAYAGYFYFGMIFKMPFIVKIATIFSFILIVYCLLQDYFLERNRSIFYWALLSILGFLCLLSIFSGYAPRYWIAFYSFILCFLLFRIVENKFNFYQTPLLLLFICNCIIALFSHRIPSHFYLIDGSERKAFALLEQKVEEQNVDALFSTDPYLQWQWNYLNGKAIPCASFNESERTNEYLKKVRTLEQKSNSQQRIAIIGFWGITDGLESVRGFNETRLQIGEKYSFTFPFKKEYSDFMRSK